MSDKPKPPPSDEDAELQREIRSDRKFSLSEAIGRMAGPGMMKGVSPVTPKRQAELIIEEYLRRHLHDAGGTLGTVLLRGVRESEQFLSNFNQPLVALMNCIQNILGSEFLLKELVRQADVEWGQVFDERPHFEKEGLPPDPDDPYTRASVRDQLTRLVERLTAGEA